MSTSTTVRRSPWLLTAIGASVAALAMVAFVLVQSADGDAAAGTLPAAAEDEPAHVEHVDGSDIARVTLTEAAAERIGLQTVSASSGPNGALVAVPYGALMYDAEGKTWVYTSLDELVFERAPIVVRSIRGERVLARLGPQPGTEVVTVGAAELWGAEFGVGH